MDATPLDRAIAHAGGVSALARLLDVRQSAVSNWQSRGVPPKQCVPIETATAGEVTRYQLRPDVFGDAPPAAAAVEPDPDAERVGPTVETA
jgi:DNA-binding transcriptional regulator YdaS (Cro superfamily)